MDADTLNLKIENLERINKEKLDSMKDDIDEIKGVVKQLPDEISSRINGYTDLKIAYEIQQLKASFFKWVCGLSFVSLGELITIVFQFITTTRK